MTTPRQRRSTTTRSLLTLTVLALLLTWLPSPAQAQVFKICGDVDDNDEVTVTDGVQVLRAAAGLTSDCTDAICDVDVNGTIGVTDGVLILRKAAGLSITQNCIPDEGRISSQLSYLIQHVQPFVSDALRTIVLHKDETIDGTSFECDNGEDGTYDIAYSDGQQDASFSTCDIGNFDIDGSADNSNDDPALSLDILDIRTEEDVTFDSDGLLGVNAADGSVKYSGRVDCSPTFEAFDTTDFTMFVSNLAIQRVGYPLGGSIQLDLREAEIPDVKQAQIFYDGSNLARVLVTFSDGTFKYYKFELLFRNFI